MFHFLNIYLPYECKENKDGYHARKLRSGSSVQTTAICQLHRRCRAQYWTMSWIRWSRIYSEHYFLYWWQIEWEILSLPHSEWYYVMLSGPPAHERMCYEWGTRRPKTQARHEIQQCKWQFLFIHEKDQAGPINIQQLCRGQCDFGGGLHYRTVFARWAIQPPRPHRHQHSWAQAPNSFPTSQLYSH